MPDYIIEILNSNLAVAFCTLISGFGGAFAGSLVTAKSLKKEENKRLVAEYYAEFASAYAAYALETRTMEDLKNLVAAIEKLRLFCPEETERYFSLLMHFAAKQEPDVMSCKTAYAEIQNAVKKIIRR